MLVRTEAATPATAAQASAMKLKPASTRTMLATRLTTALVTLMQ